MLPSTSKRVSSQKNWSNWVLISYPIYVSFYNRKTKERAVITDGFASNELRFFLSTKSLPFEKHWISKYSIPLDEEHHDPSTYFIHYKTCKSSLAVEPFTAVFNPHKVFITDFFSGDNQP